MLWSGIKAVQEQAIERVGNLNFALLTFRRRSLGKESIF